MGFLNMGSVTVGKIFGIPLKLHFTLFIIAPIFVWLLGNYFASMGLAWPLWQYYGLLGLASLLTMETSVIIHELAHCLVAKRNGIPIRDITLSMFGGIAHMEKDSKSAGEEFKIAIAGPAVSFILAWMFWAIQYSLFKNVGVNFLSLTANMIFLINLVLGAFNLFIPAFPMDGGRILKSVLWKKFGKPKATDWVIKIGKIFGLILMVAGLSWVFLFGNWLGGTILSGIGLGLFLQKKPAGGRPAAPATDQKKRKAWLIVLICAGSLLIVSAAIFLYSVRESSIEKLNYSGPGSFEEIAHQGKLKELGTSGQLVWGGYEKNGQLQKFKTTLPTALTLLTPEYSAFTATNKDVETLSYTGKGSFLEKAENWQLREINTTGPKIWGIYEEGGHLKSFVTSAPERTSFYIGQNYYTVEDYIRELYRIKNQELTIRSYSYVIFSSVEDYFKAMYRNIYNTDLPIVSQEYRAKPSIEFYIIMGLGLLFFVALLTLGWYWLWGRQMKQSKEFMEKSLRKYSGEKISLINDVAGIEEVKTELKKIPHFIKEPQRYREVGARIPTGIILHGPPGCGKTLIARAIASEANIPFFAIVGSEFVEMFVGVGAARIRDFFKNAKKYAPCIIFVDELDALLMPRGASSSGGGAKEEQNQTVNQFLAETSGIEPGSGVIILAATNRFDMLDPAAIRSGRFDWKIYVPLPDIKGREEILKVHTRNKPLAPDISLKALAGELKLGTSGADIENICNEAAMLAVGERQEQEEKEKRKIETPMLITKASFTEAIYKVSYGPKKKSLVMSDEDKEGTAFHEAGHTIINHFCEYLNPVSIVTIVPRGDFLGFMDTMVEKESFTETKAKLREIGLRLLGGLAAEKIFLRTQTTGARDDLVKATLLKLKMKYQYGMGKIGPIGIPLDDLEGIFRREPLNPALLKAVEEIAPEIQVDLEEAERILKKHEPEVRKLVAKLIQEETILGNEFRQILKDAQTASEN